MIVKKAEEMFLKACKGIDDKWFPNSFNIAKKHYPEAYYNVLEMDEKLNVVWKELIDGLTTIEQFRNTLKEWYFSHLKISEVSRVIAGKIS